MDTDCIFCKIINEQIEAKKIYEDQNVLAIFDAYPKVEGHTLILPKKHYANIMEKSDTVDLLAYVPIVVKELKKQYKFNDFKIIINNGVKAGQEVFHLHIHILPFIED